MGLIEGRNRQIRRMAEAVGLRVMQLHRTSFAGLTLRGLKGAGSWVELDNKEMTIINQLLHETTAAAAADNNDDNGDD